MEFNIEVPHAFDARVPPGRTLAGFSRCDQDRKGRANLPQQHKALNPHNESILGQMLAK
jgi:hypothetical protein